MLKVNWNESMCSHSGNCVNSLPEVFKVEDGNFIIEPDAADKEKVREVCASCPSGALTVNDG